MTTHGDGHWLTYLLRKNPACPHRLCSAAALRRDFLRDLDTQYRSVLAFHLIDFSRYFFEQSNTRNAT